MNKFISLALLIGGLVLVVYGLTASDSLSSSFSRFFTGSPTDKSIWMLIVGVVCAAVGFGGLTRGPGVS
jgi:amino acid permease